MTTSTERRLVSLKREVAAAAAELYDEIWAGIVAAATATGAHAWRFSAASDPTLRLEFLEFKAGADPRSATEAGALLGRLDREIAPAIVEEWLEDR